MERYVESIYAIGDVTGDGVVNVEDLVAVILAWGPCPSPGECPADVDGNGQLDLQDIVTYIEAFTDGCE